jgi:hypothetical protein
MEDFRMLSNSPAFKLLTQLICLWTLSS